MVKNFIILEDFCDFCPENAVAIILSGADIDMVDVHLGDPRAESLKKQMKERFGKFVVPTGIYYNMLINYSRDTGYMYRFYKKGEG